jgi:hypothetical protein
MLLLEICLEERVMNTHNIIQIAKYNGLIYQIYIQLDNLILNLKKAVFKSK